MKRQALDCDKCGVKDDPTCNSFCIPAGSKQDGAGSTESTSWDFELCNKCTAAAVHILLDPQNKDCPPEDLVYKIVNKRIKAY